MRLRLVRKILSCLRLEVKEIGANHFQIDVRLNVNIERRYDSECRFTVSFRRRHSSYGTFWRPPKTLGHFGTLLSQSRTGEMPCIQHSHVGAIIAYCHRGPPWEALVVSWLAVEGDRRIALFEPVALFLLPGARLSLQQPLFRSLPIGKRLDFYTSITSRQQEKPSRVHSLWFLNKCDFYPVSRENLRFFRRQEFFYNGDFPLSSRYVNEKFIALRAPAMLGN